MIADFEIRPSNQQMTENDFIVSLQGLFEMAYSQGFSLDWIYDRTELAAEEFLELHGYYEDLNND